MDLRYVKTVPSKLIDRAPAAFTFPQAPALWEFDAHKAYVRASDEDVAAVPGAAESQKLEKRCDDSALDKCAAASSKVKEGPWRPDIDERADRACEQAKQRERQRCMGGKDGDRWEAIAKKLDDRLRKRTTADFEALKGKLATK
jgi:hypothetical protein